MSSKHLLQVLAASGVAACVAFTWPATAQAQVRRGRAPVVVGRAVPRGAVVAPRFIRPPVVAAVPYRPYYYRPGFTFSVGGGYPYYGGYDAYGYPYYGYPYGYSYGGGYPYGYVAGAAYGGVRLQVHDRNAQVYVDGYYAGVVDNFDGAFQHLDLPSGPHHVEVRAAGLTPVAFDVNVVPGQTITYRADPAQP